MMRALFLVFAMAAASLHAGPLQYVKDMNGKDYFPLGVNYAWQDWGVDFADQGWPERFKKIEANLDLMQARGVRTLRWWVFTDFVASPLWSGQGDQLRCTGLPKGWVENFMKTVEAAHARGIRLYPVFSSFDLGRKGFKWVVSDKAVRASFIEKAVRPLLKAAAGHEGVFAWDIINEPEWLVRKEDGGDPNKELTDGPVSLSQLRAYITDMAKKVKASARQPVSVGSAGIKWCGWQYDFYSGLGLDFFDVHYYDWMTPWFDITTTPKAGLAKMNAEYGEKAMIIGETIPMPETQYSGKSGPKDHTRFLKDIMAMGYAGYLPWAWNEKKDLDCREAIVPHFNQALKNLNLPGLTETPQAGNGNSGNPAAFVQRMGLGWNLGNTMEACGDWIKGKQVRDFETAWGAPLTTPAMFARIKKAGFDSVRVPVAWSNLMEENHTIHAPLIKRVQEVVDMALAEKLIVVLNIHWDGGWWKQFETDEAAAMKRYRRIWTQIADNFKNHPQALVLESLNEEACFNGVWDRWGNKGSKSEAFGLANRINQAFVDLVRNSGGHNKTRPLLIAGYCTDIELTIDPLFKMPDDPAGRQILSVHYYTPFGFTHLTKDESWAKADPDWGSVADQAELKKYMEKLKERYLNQGVPIIIGEYGATRDKKETDSVRDYILSVAKISREMGMCPMLWDPQGTHFDRHKLEFVDPKLEEGFLKIKADKH